MIRFSWKSINQRPIVRRIERKSTRVDTRSLVSCFRLKKQVMANSILSRRRHESWTNWERRYWESINPLIINHDSWIVIRLLSSKYQLVPIGNFFVAIYLLKLNENEEWNVIWKRNCFPFNSWFDIVCLSFIKKISFNTKKLILKFGVVLENKKIKKHLLTLFFFSPRLFLLCKWTFVKVKRY